MGLELIPSFCSAQGGESLTPPHLGWDNRQLLVYFEHKPVLVFSWIDQGFAKNKCLVKKTQHTKSIDNEI